MKTIGFPRIMQPFFAHLMTFIFVPSFKKISPRVSELSSGHILKFTKEHNPIKNVHVGGVTVLVMSTSPDNALYLSQNFRKFINWSLS